MADTAVLDEPEVQDGPPPGSIVKPIEAQGDAGDELPEGAIIKPIGDAPVVRQPASTPMLPQGTMQAHEPTFGERLRAEVSNTAPGRAIISTMPKVASTFGLTPTLSESNPDAARQAQQVAAPEYFQPEISSLDRAAGIDSEKNRNRVRGALKGLGGMTSGEAMAMLAGTSAAAAATAGLVNPASAAVLHRLVAGGFTFDMLHSLYQQNKEYRKAVDSGNTSEAQQIQGEMGLTGAMALMTGAHSLHGVAGRPTATEVDLTKEAVHEADKAGAEPREAVTEGGEDRPPAGAIIKPIKPIDVDDDDRGGGGGAGDTSRGITAAANADAMLEKRRKTMRDERRINDADDDGGGPFKKKPTVTAVSDKSSESVLKPLAAEATNELQPVGEKHEETGRDILQPTDNPVTLDKAAQAAAPHLETGIEDAVKGIKGARLEAVREQKNPERLAEKISEEGQPAQTIPDYLASRVVVDSPAARDAAVKAIKDKFPVVREEDKFDDGDEDYGYRRHALQVRMPNGISAEVHIVPKEVAAVNADEHENYKAAREADLSGDDKTFKAAAAEAKAKNDAAMGKFNERNATKEPKYEFGSTQANIPVDSDAHKALSSARASIADDDLAGKGKDVGDNHVTVRYGIQDNETGDIEKYLRQQAPFEVKMGKTSTFPVNKNTEGAAVIKADVDAPELHRMNAEIAKHGNFKESDFPDYKPHATVAYVKPEAVSKYVGMDETDGKTFPVKSVAISSREGKLKEIPLEGGKKGDAENTLVPAKEQAAGVAGTLAPAPKIEKGTRVKLKDGTTGKIDYYNEAMGRARVTTDAGKRLPNVAKAEMTALPVEGAGRWTGVDLDGTLAHYDGYKGPEHIGKPVAAMTDRVKEWLKAGKDVRIFTARVANDPQGLALKAIEDWSENNLGKKLPVTNVKDEKMEQLWDDRAVQVGRNTGEVIGGEDESLRQPGAASVLQPAQADNRAEGSGRVQRGEQGTKEPAGARVEQEEQRGRPAAKADEKGEVAPAKRKGIMEPAENGGFIEHKRDGTLEYHQGRAADAAGPEAEKPTRKELEDAGQKPMFKRENDKARTWYLKSDKLIDQKMKGPMTGDQLLKMLENGGVKAAELKWTGLQEFLKGKFRVKPEEVKQHLAEGGIQIQEVTKGNVDPDAIPPNWDFTETMPEETKYSQYQLPGGQNYREMLLTLPPRLPKSDALAAFRDKMTDKYGFPIVTEEGAKRFTPEEREQYRNILAAADAEDAASSATFKSSHWEEPNILAHVRMNDRVTPDGKRLLHIEEIQSDWAQSRRKELKTLTAPESVRELSDYVLGRELASLMPLDVVDGGMLTALKNDKVRRFVISRLSVDVVNDLATQKLTPDDIFRNQDVLISRLPVDHLSRVAAGLTNALRETGAEMRAKLATAYKTGRDEYILPAVKASDVGARVVVGLLSPASIYDPGDSGGRIEPSSTRLRAEPAAGRSRSVSRDGNTAPGAGDGAKGTPANIGAESGGASTGLDAKGREARVTDLIEWHDGIVSKAGGVKQLRTPATPFIDFAPMAFRRMVRLAAEKGYDGVSWTPGEKQAERYDLSKHIDKLQWDRNPDGTYDLMARKGGEKVFGRERIDAAELPNIIGKELARKIVDEKGHIGVYEGLDLKVGGEGMKGFYDKIIPDYARKFGKQWGAKVEETSIPSEKYGTGFDSSKAKVKKRAEGVYQVWIEGKISGGNFDTKAEAEAYAATGATTKVPYLPITPEMRKAVTTEGVPMFKRGDALDEGKSKGRFFVVPAEANNSPMVHIDNNIRDALNVIEPDLAAGGSWPAASLPKSYVDKLVQRLRLKRTPKASQLADMINSARDEEGNAILLTPEGKEWVAEEQFHGFQHRWGAQLGDVMLQIGQSPELLKAQRYLRKEGYSGNLVEAAQEATAKTFNGDWAGAGLTRQEGASVLKEFLDAVVLVRGKDALTDLPRIKEDIADVIEEAYERHQVPKRERSSAATEAGAEASDRAGADGGGSLRGGEAGGPAGSDRRGTQARLFKRGVDGKVIVEKAAPKEEEKESATPIPLNRLIDASIDMSTVKTPIATRIQKSVENSVGHLTKDASSVATGLAEAKGAMAGLWDAYRNLPPWTNFKDMLGKFLGAMQTEHWYLGKYAKELKRVVPDKDRRIAMTNWVEANGDKNLLMDRARASKTPELKAGYELATQLSPEEVQIARAGKEYFRQMFEAGKSANLLDQAAGDYIMHIHEPDSKAANQLRSLINFSELNPNPSIIKERVFRSYFDAEQGGETPKDKDFGFLTAAYQDTFARAIHSRTFIRQLLEGKAKDGRPLATLGGKGKWAQLDPSDEPYVLQQQKRPDRLAHDITDYRYMDHPALRNWLWELTDKDAEELNPKLFEDATKALAIRGDIMLHPEIYSHVDNVLKRSAVRKYWLGRTALNTSNTLKQSLLSFSAFHQTQETVHGLEHLVNPVKLVLLNLADKTQRALVDHGLMVAEFDGESAMSEGISTSTLKYVPLIGDAMAKYQNYLFKDYIPRMKMTMALHALERNRVRFKNELSDDQILEMTANQSNAAFGGQNYKMMGRNPTFQDVVRLMALAPDFLESRVKFVGQALTPYGKEQRIALIRGALVMYVGARILNSILNDGDAKWDSADMFKVVYKGKKFGLRTVQGDILGFVNDPKMFVAHRLNPMTTRPFIEWITGRDEFGRQKSDISQVKDYGKSVVPIPFQSRMKSAETTWLDTIMNAVGGEMSKYRTPAETLAHKTRMANIPDKPEDPDADKVEESRLRYKFVRQLRSGEKDSTDLWNAVNDGKLTPAEAKAAQTEAEMTELEYDVSKIGAEDIVKVYEKANEAERRDIEPILQKKRQNFEADDTKTPKAKEKLESKMEELHLN